VNRPLRELAGLRLRTMRAPTGRREPLARPAAGWRGNQAYYPLPELPAQTALRSRRRPERPARFRLVPGYRRPQ